jgi:hypothetical protein
LNTEIRHVLEQFKWLIKKEQEDSEVLLEAPILDIEIK